MTWWGWVILIWVVSYIGVVIAFRMRSITEVIDINDRIGYFILAPIVFVVVGLGFVEELIVEVFDK